MLTAFWILLSIKILQLHQWRYFTIGRSLESFNWTGIVWIIESVHKQKWSVNCRLIEWKRANLESKSNRISRSCQIISEAASFFALILGYCPCQYHIIEIFYNYIRRQMLLHLNIHSRYPSLMIRPISHCSSIKFHENDIYAWHASKNTNCQTNIHHLYQWANL